MSVTVGVLVGGILTPLVSPEGYHKGEASEKFCADPDRFSDDFLGDKVLVDVPECAQGFVEVVIARVLSGRGVVMEIFLGIVLRPLKTHIDCRKRWCCRKS